MLAPLLAILVGALPVILHTLHVLRACPDSRYLATPCSGLTIPIAALVHAPPVGDIPASVDPPMLFDPLK